MKPAPLIVLLALLAFLAGGCGGSESTVTAKEDGADLDWTELKRVPGIPSERLLIPAGPPPKKVVIRDLKRGTGPVVTTADTIKVNYISFHYHRQEAIERYWRPPPSKFIWGVGDLVEGWEPGLKGMQVGGIRELIVPSALAYEYGPLVYLVKLVQLESN